MRFSASLSALLVLAAVQLHAAPRVLPEGKLPDDARLGPLKELDGYFPFEPSANAAEWERRADVVRTQMRVALGLFPEPARTPLNAVVRGRVERDDFTVERVVFESVPGFYVTGSLFRPKGIEGRKPAVLCPHGHWPDGRFMDAGEAGVKKEIARGAETFAEGGRSPLQARCVQLARMGCVVFFVDMLGYADSQQIGYDVAHKFAKQRPEMNAADGWGLFSPRAESWSLNIMGLQTWNAIRALDFLQSLPDVDPARIGCTGASGGGTQTFILTALDPRVTAAFPAVMVSTAMQGGCTCENCAGLRIGTGNIEFAALAAPRPLGMTAADDWTKEMPTKGFPELQRHYAMLGVPDRVQLTPLLQFPHNYNAPSRAAMAQWFNRHLGLNLPPERVAERDYQRLSREELTVWDAEHPAPASGPEFEKKLLRQLRDEAAVKLTDIIARNGWRAIIGRELPADADATRERTITHDGWKEILGFIRVPSWKSEIPGIAIEPADPNGTAVIWLHTHGKAGLYNDDGTPRAEVASLVANGTVVIGLDLFRQGEFLAADAATGFQPKSKNPREAAAYTYGYNHPLFVQRVHDVLAAVAALRVKTPRLAVVALDDTAPVALAAQVVAGEKLPTVLVRESDFRFENVPTIYDPMFVPASARFGDVPALIRLGGTRVKTLAPNAAATPALKTLFAP